MVAPFTQANLKGLTEPASLDLGRILNHVVLKKALLSGKKEWQIGAHRTLSSQSIRVRETTREKKEGAFAGSRRSRS